MTAITDDDLRRLGFTRFTATAWRKYSSDLDTCVRVYGPDHTVDVEQSLYGRTSRIYCPHIKTPEELEALCAVVLGDFRTITVTDRRSSIADWLRRLFGGRQ